MSPGAGGLLSSIRPPPGRSTATGLKDGSPIVAVLRQAEVAGGPEAGEGMILPPGAIGGQALPTGRRAHGDDVEHGGRPERPQGAITGGSGRGQVRGQKDERSAGAGRAEDRCPPESSPQ